MAVKEKIRIRIKGYDHQVVDQAAEKIVQTAKRTGARVSGPVPLPFPDALYFSLVTQATVGYGDVTPHDDGIRLLASLQVILGQVLLLFGFAEIMRTRRVLGGEGGRRPGSANE